MVLLTLLDLPTTVPTMTLVRTQQGYWLAVVLLVPLDVGCLICFFFFSWFCLCLFICVSLLHFTTFPSVIYMSMEENVTLLFIFCASFSESTERETNSRHKSRNLGVCSCNFDPFVQISAPFFVNNCRQEHHGIIFFVFNLVVFIGYHAYGLQALFCWYILCCKVTKR